MRRKMGEWRREVREGKLERGRWRREDRGGKKDRERKMLIGREWRRRYVQ